MKKSYYGNLEVNDVCDNIKFWSTVKPLLSDKVKNSEKVVLIENDEILSKDTEVCEVMNNFFANIVTDLNIPQYKTNELNDNNITDPILKMIDK